MKPLRLLLVEDSAEDAALLCRELEHAGYGLDVLLVDSLDDLRRALETREWDLAITDFRLGGFTGLESLAALRQARPELPVLVVSGTVGEETAVEVLRAGAADFLLKDRLARVPPAVARCLEDARLRRERARAESALLDSERKYRQIVETSQEGIWTLDAAGRTTFVNRRMAEFLGTTPDEVLGSLALDFVPADARPEAEAALARQAGGPHVLEQRLRRLDGGEFWASISAAPIFDDQGRFQGSLGMVTDLTEQKKLQAQLLVADRMVSVGTLAAGVAHEINNPLAAVLANLDIALADLQPLRVELPPGRIEEVLEALSDARDAGRRVRSIVKDLKLFSRAVEDTRGAVDVCEVLESTARMAWNEIRHRARLAKDFQPVPPVLANESRLGQVFLNLLVNAAQAIPEGHAETNEIRLRTALAPDGRVVVEVRDTGTGIPPDVQHRLFTPFFTTKPVGVGTGLGLSICHRIVTGLGGEITVESEPGKGTVFRVLLPPGTVPAVEAAAPSEPSHRPRRRASVLVIDDEPILGSAIRRALAPDHDVDVCVRAADALSEIVAGRRFDLVLCDLMMPEMTGMDLHAELVRLAPEQARRIVFLTGGAFTPRAQQFLEEVDNPRLEKPFDVAELRALIDARLQ